MKIADAREMRPDELQVKLEELQRHLFDLRSQAVTETLENSKAIRNIKRDIARIMTVIRQRQIEGAQSV
jgi:large subunit ribosomal protein L29